MSQATIRTALYNCVNGVSGTGSVHDYKRWAVLYDDYIDKFKDSTAGTILGFDIEAGPFTDEWVNFRQSTSDAGIVRTWTYRIRMYYGWIDGDETEKAAATLLESVANALNSTDAVHAFHHTSPVRVPTLEPRMFGGNLVHFAQMEIDVSEAMT